MRFNCAECGRWFDEDQIASEYDGIEICKACYGLPDRVFPETDEEMEVFKQMTNTDWGRG